MKWTLVTGGAQRLGAEICRALAEKGHSILVHYRTSKEKAEKVAETCQKYGVEAKTIQGDFSSLESTRHFAKECLEHYPEIENLINNVGNYLIESALDTTPEEWNALFQTNLHAPFLLCHAFLSSLKAHRGHIINIGVSGINHVYADTKRTAYMTAKMALLMLTKSLARELASSGVCVNMVSPGYLENAVDLSDAKLPMQRPASVHEISRVIVFLMENESRYITGQNIEVSGGIGLKI